MPNMETWSQLPGGRSRPPGLRFLPRKMGSSASTVRVIARKTEMWAKEPLSRQPPTPGLCRAQAAPWPHPT